MDVEARDRIPRDVCRVCLTSGQNARRIFPEDPGLLEAEDISEMIRLCGGVQIGADDGLPGTVCTGCLARLKDARELRRQCQAADAKLRELYGIIKIKYGSSGRTRDQSCQTDYTFTLDSVKPETGLSRLDPSKDHLGERTEEARKPSSLGSEYGEYQEPGNCYPSQNVRVRRKQTGYEKAGREVYRTRMTMFKRVTSMESLKNHKERQRQYIKKSNQVKPAENDFSVKVKSATRSIYTCAKCNGRFTSKRSLDKHVVSHDQGQFTREKCNKQFCQPEKLLRHSELHKLKQKPEPVSCRICNKSFRKIDTMVRHLNAHKRVNPKEVLDILKEIRDKRRLENCVEREREAVSNGNDKRTRETIANQGKENANYGTSEPNENIRPDSVLKREDSPLYQCHHCNKEYTTEKSLQRHLSVHEEKKFVCNVCNMKFFRQDRLASHKSRYGHDGGRVEGAERPSDEKSAIKLINTWIREELDSDNEGKGFPCDLCGKSYDTRKSLLKHRVNAHDSHEEEEEDPCATCPDTCDCTEKSVRAQEKPGNGKSKPYRCEQCDKCFEKEIKLQRHARIHERAREQQDSNFKRFLCHICSKTFRQNTGLMFHMRTHTGYKPHVCKYCGRGFTSNSNCINHERTHTGDRPFVCHFCSAAFAKSCTLKAHITTHTGEANYHCKTCGKSFRRLKYLKEHRFTHTGEKPYACKICGTAYSHSGSLFVHEKKCKAQYGSYQPSNTVHQESYDKPQTSSCSSSSRPIITGLPQAHFMTPEPSKTYIDNIHRMNSQCATATSTSNVANQTTVENVPSAVRNFSLIGQIFQS